MPLGSNADYTTEGYERYEHGYERVPVPRVRQGVWTGVQGVQRVRREVTGVLGCTLSLGVSRYES